MKLVQGTGFHQWLLDPSHRPGSNERLEEGLEIFLKVCDALAYAHHRGVIHRDLKPDNIIVAGFGQVYVMDWGLARLSRTRPASGENAQMEAPGPVGTPAYMSPEQARGNPAEMDERSDVFGLGAILYEIVSGRTPFGPEMDPDRIIELSKAGRVIPVEQQARGIGISKRIRNIIMKAVDPRPADRYQTVVELQSDVHAFLLGGLHLPRKAYGPSDIIIREGDAGEAAYIIVSGKCRAFRQVDDHEETLTTMGPGDVFGEMALLLDEPRAASVQAVEPVTLLVLDRATLSEGLGVEGWTGALVRALAQRFRDLEQRVRSSGLRRG
jgi:serine/threonine protein kinase